MLFFILILFMLYFIDSQQQSTLNIFKTRMQSRVRKLANAYQNINLCSQQVKNCQIKSANLCINTPPKICMKNYPKMEQCLTNGVMLSDQSGIRIPNIFNSNNLNQNISQFICASATIQQTFHQIFKQNYHQYTYSFIGSRYGPLRLHPTKLQQLRHQDGKCQDYDPRIRPWYVSAITSPKIFIILFDISKTMQSMFPGSRFKNSITTLNTIIDTLGQQDQIIIVNFSKHSNIFGRFKNLNSSQKQKLKIKIQNIRTQQGLTNYTAAIQTVLKLNLKISSCQLLTMIFLTDGYTQIDNQKTYQNISKIIRQNLPYQNILITSFVYGVQRNIKYQFIKQLTNQYQGLIFRMQDGIDQITMIYRISTFYQYLSENYGQIKQPKWSQVYQDAFGFGLICSVSLAIYNINQIPKIQAVAGLDIMLQKFVGNEQQLNIVSNWHKTDNRKCFQKVQKQRWNLLRCKAYQHSLPNCSQYLQLYQQNRKNNRLCLQQSNKVFQQSYLFQTDDNICCGMTKKQFYIVIYTSVGGFILFLIIIILIITRKKTKIFDRLFKNKFQTQRSQKQNQESQISQQSLNNYIKDPQRKYKLAFQNGVNIYDQPQFII